jgi:hypothetical protein
VTTAVAPGGDDHQQRLEELLAQLRRLDPSASLGSTGDAASVRFRARSNDLRARLQAARQAQHDRGRDDLTAALDAIVARAPQRLRPVFKPRPATRPFDPNEAFWSPTAILGFRGWQITDRVLHGAKRAWPTPRYVAGCLRGSQEILTTDVPHTRGECGAPPCGIYATKEPGPIVDMFIDLGAPFALGLVELAGKVVEHEYGYRAAEATAVAMVVIVGGRVVNVDRVPATGLFDDRTPMESLFEDARPFVDEASRGPVVGPEQLREILSTLRVGHESRRAA